MKEKLTATKLQNNNESFSLSFSLENRTTLRSSNIIAGVVFQPDDVLVLRRYPEAENPEMFSVVAAVLIPLDEPQSATERETIPAAVLYRMVVKLSERISEYMGDVSIELINGEKKPSHVSESESTDKNTIRKRTQAAGRQQENKFSSVGVAGIVVGALIFLMIIIFVAVLLYR